MGRPGIRTSDELRARFFAVREEGGSLRTASAAAGVAHVTGRRWEDEFNRIVRRAPDWQPGGRALCLAEREEIAIGRALGETLQQIGDRIGRDKSVISRELARNSNKDGTYRAVSAHRRAWERTLRPKTLKLMDNPQLWRWVLAKLKLRWSPQQISARLVVEFPDRPEMRVSHETIYQCVYVLAKGELRKELSAALRSGRVPRKTHGRVPSTARYLGEKILISERPAEIEDRAVPGHWESQCCCQAA